MDICISETTHDYRLINCLVAIPVWMSYTFQLFKIILEASGKISHKMWIQYDVEHISPIRNQKNQGDSISFYLNMLF